MGTEIGTHYCFFLLLAPSGRAKSMMIKMPINAYNSSGSSSSGSGIGGCGCGGTAGVVCWAGGCGTGALFF